MVGSASALIHTWLFTVALQGHASSPGGHFHHPGLNGGLFHKDALLLSEGANRIARRLNGLMTVVSHVARLQHVVDQVTLTLGSFFQVVYGIFNGTYFSYQVPLLLQVDRAIEQLWGRFYLTDFCR